MTTEERKEIAAHSQAIAKILYKNTWYHLMENLHKIGGSNQRLSAARSLLWLGKIDETIALFNDCILDQSALLASWGKM